VSCGQCLLVITADLSRGGLTQDLDSHVDIKTLQTKGGSHKPCVEGEFGCHSSSSITVGHRDLVIDESEQEPEVYQKVYFGLFFTHALSPFSRRNYKR